MNTMPEPWVAHAKTLIGTPEEALARLVETAGRHGWSLQSRRTNYASMKRGTDQVTIVLVSGLIKVSRTQIIDNTDAAVTALSWIQEESNT